MIHGADLNRSPPLPLYCSYGYRLYLEPEPESSWTVAEYQKPSESSASSFSPLAGVYGSAISNV